MYYSLLAPRSVYKQPINKLSVALDLPKGSKIIIISNNNGKVKREVKTREQLIKEAVEELK